MADLLADIEIAPREVQRLLGRRRGFLLVDVREAWKHDAAKIQGSVLIPLSEIPGSLSRLGGAGRIVLYCHHEIRRFDAAAWLRSQGVGSAKSMTGGIER
jgi:rhodanese-related sulfurtransferase